MTDTRSTSLLARLVGWLLILSTFMSLSLVTLKLARISDISWWTAFSPTIVAAAVYFGVIAVLLLLAGIFHLIGKIIDAQDAAKADREAEAQRKLVVDAMTGRK